MTNDEDAEERAVAWDARELGWQEYMAEYGYDSMTVQHGGSDADFDAGFASGWTSARKYFCGR